MEDSNIGRNSIKHEGYVLTCLVWMRACGGGLVHFPIQGADKAISRHLVGSAPIST
nr:hypothetical protein [Candidatus Baldrarchaeota archaeon]